MNAVLSGHHPPMPLPGAQHHAPHVDHPFLIDAGKAALVNLVFVALLETFGGGGLQRAVHPQYWGTLAAAACIVAACTMHWQATRLRHDYVLVGMTFIVQVVLALAWNLGVLWVLLHR